VEKVEDLLVLPPERLSARLGERAERLLELAVGEDERPVIPDHEAKSIGHELTFAADIGDEEELQNILDRLVAQVGRRLRKNGLLARTVQIKARFPDFSTLSRAQTLPRPTDSTSQIRDAARFLFGEKLTRGGRPLRLVGVSVTNLACPERAQGELFPDPAQAKQRRLDQVLDKVQGKYGPNAVRRGASRPGRS
jgi:DNA polymerase-4